MPPPGSAAIDQTGRIFPLYRKTLPELATQLPAGKGEPMWSPFTGGQLSARTAGSSVIVRLSMLECVVW